MAVQADRLLGTLDGLEHVVEGDIRSAHKRLKQSIASYPARSAPPAN
jgi:hypothetical protein